VFDTDPVGLAHMDGDRDGLACEQLPAPPPPPIPSVDALKSTTGIYGVHTRDAPWWMGEVDHLARLTGKTPGTVLFFANFAQAFPAGPVDTVWARGMLPVVAWEPIVPGASRQPRLGEIIDGTYDAYIDQWATATRDHGKPIVLRFAAEMNGNWYPWSESVNGNSQGEYVQAWRHLHDRFEAVGADNVIWLWSSNRVDSLSTTLSSYYPGDAYVDWIGMAGYWRQVRAGQPPTFATTFGRTLTQLRAISNKPILLSEVGAGTDEANKIAWIRSFFDGLAASPDIIGFIWFNDQKSGGDWRIQVTQGIVDAFADGVDDSRWRTGVDPGGMIPGQRITVPARGVS